MTRWVAANPHRARNQAERQDRRHTVRRLRGFDRRNDAHLPKPALGRPPLVEWHAGGRGNAVPPTRASLRATNLRNDALAGDPPQLARLRNGTQRATIPRKSVYGEPTDGALRNGTQNLAKSGASFFVRVLHRRAASVIPTRHRPPEMSPGGAGTRSRVPVTTLAAGEPGRRTTRWPRVRGGDRRSPGTDAGLPKRWAARFPCPRYGSTRPPQRPGRGGGRLPR